LSISLAVDLIGKQLSKRVAIHIGGSEDRFVVVLARAGIIIVLGHYVGLCLGTERQKQQHREHLGKSHSPGKCGFQEIKSGVKEIFC
jgi:hypothetical protein